MNIKDKQQITLQLLSFVANKIQTLQKQINNLAIDAQNDAKGSAGDKHETGLAMMHLEQEKLSANLKQAVMQQQQLLKISVDAIHQAVGLGSLVITQNGCFFISDAFPSFTYKNNTIFPVSVNAPVYRFLKGKKAGDEIDFNNKKNKIKQII